MARIALAGAEPELEAALRTLAARTPGGRVDVVDLDRLLAAGVIAADALVLPAAGDAVELLQRVARADRELGVVVLCDADEVDSIRRAVRFAPAVGAEVAVRARDGAGTLAADVLEVARRTVARRRRRPSAPDAPPGAPEGAGDEGRLRTLLTVQFEIMRALADSDTVGEAARRIMAAVCGMAGWQLGALWRADRYAGVLRFVDVWAGPDVEERFRRETRDVVFRRGEGMLGRAWVQAGPTWVEDLWADERVVPARRDLFVALGLRSAFNVPLEVGGEVIGMLEFLSAERRPADPELLGVLAAAAGQVGQFVERISAEEDLRRVERQRDRLVGAMLLAVGEERRLLARDLHDDTIQVLTAVMLQLDRLGRRLREGETATAEQAIARTRDTLLYATERVRRLTFALRPHVLEEHGLGVAIRELVEAGAGESGFEATVDVQVGRHPWVVEELVFAVVAAAFANVQMHAGARTVRVEVHERDGRLEGVVEDDGAGFDPGRTHATDRVSTTLGIDLVAERVRLAGGSWELVSAPGAGTAVRFGVPVHAHAVPTPEEAREEFRLHGRAEEWFALLDTLLDRAPIGIGFWDRRFRYVRLNDALAEMNGLSVDGHIGRTVEEVVPAVWAQAEPIFRAVIERGESFRDLELTGESPARPGRERTWLSSYYPVQSRGGEVLGVGAVVVDVTERKAAEDERAALLAETRAARDRLVLLSSVSAVLADTIELAPTLEHVARLVVATLADWCEVDLVEAGGLEPAARAHADPGDAELLAEFHPREHPWSAERAEAVATRRAAALDAGRLAPAGGDQRSRELLARLRPGSVMLVPLVVHGRAVGLLTCVRTSDRPPFGADDLTLAQEIASRAGVAIDNARLFEERSTVARTLQNRLLPPAPPDVPGLTWAARLLPAGAAVGGDFYDVFDAGGGEWAIVIGDVSGKGVEAAALTGLVRHTMRAVATLRRDAGALEAVNRAMLEEGSEQFCTLVYGRYRPTAAGGRLELRLAGHPPPYQVRPDGTVHAIGVPGTLLGFLPEPTLAATTVDLVLGDTVVLYTDGITEAKRDGELFGESRLTVLLAELAGRPPEEIVAGVVDAVRRFEPGPRDDVSILVLTVTGA